MVHCNNVCLKYKVKRRYFPGVRYCSNCDYFLKTEKKACPCCHTLLRIKRKNNLVKKMLQ